jgi:hypothetical protein
MARTLAEMTSGTLVSEGFRGSYRLDHAHEQRHHRVNPRQSTSRPNTEILIMVGMVVILVVPLLWFAHLPTEDGPGHNALASAVGSLLASSNTTIDRFYFLEIFPTPNLLSTATLVVLQVFLSPIVAEKVMVAGFVTGLAFSIRYALGGIRQEATVLSLLAVPLGLGLVAHFGFYNFIAGVIMFVITIGYWQRHFRSPSGNVPKRSVIVLGALLLLTYLGHLLPYIAAIFVVAVVPLGATFAAEPRGQVGRWNRLAVDYWNRTRPVLVAALASLVLLALYILRASGGDVGGSRGLIGRIARLGSFSELFVVFTVRETLFSAMIAATTVACVVVAMRQRSKWGWTPRSSDGYLAATIIFAVVYLFVPDRIAGGSAVPERLAMFTFIVALMWLAYFRYARWLRITIVAVSVLATIGLVGMRWQAYQGFDRDLAEYASGTSVVADGSTVLPLFLVDHDSGVGDTTPAYRMRPLIEAGSNVTPLNGAVNLNHLHAEYNYSVAQFKPELNARLLLGVPQGSADPIYAVPPRVDILAFEDQTGETVDVVLLWGRRFANPDVLADEATVALLALLDEGYELIHVSSDRGLMEVYVRS